MARCATSTREHSLLLNIEEEHLDFMPISRQLNRSSHNCSIKPAAAFSIMQMTRIVSVFAARARMRSSTVSRKADYRGADIELRDIASVFCVRRGEQLVKRC
jgi:hypothetical protein